MPAYDKLNCCGCGEPGNGLTTFLLTLRNISGTTDPVVIADATIPKNTWKDGEEIILELVAQLIGGSAGTAALAIGVNADTSFDPTDTQGIISLTDNSTTKYKLRFLRVGSDVWCLDQNNSIFQVRYLVPGGGAGQLLNTNEWAGWGPQSANTPGSYQQVNFPDTNGSGFSVGKIFAGVNFAADVLLSVTLGLLDPIQQTWTPINGACYKFPALFQIL